MPEIVECRRYVDQMNDEYGGHSLLNVEVVGGRFLKEPVENLTLITYPLNKCRFDSKGKFIWAEFEDPTVPQDEGGKTYFFITLGMSASFGKLNKHSALKFTFDNGDVYYNDIRHFGTIKVGLSPQELNKKLNSLGWDALQEPYFKPEIIKQLRKKNNKTISEVLLDQKIFCGIGNYLRSEGLYNSKINPFTEIKNLSDNDIETLCNSLIKIVKAAYDCGGATLATYSDLYGNVGTFFNQFKVYGKKKDPLGNEVIRMTAPDGRTVHMVPSIQTL